MSNGDGGRRIEADEIEAFCSKLEQWAKQLEPTEQSLARLMLARARRAREIDTEGISYEGEEPWNELIASLFRGMSRPEPEYEVIDIEAPAFFAKEAGPTWVKGAWVETADVEEEVLPAEAPAASGPGQDSVAKDPSPSVGVFAQQLGAYAETLAPRERQMLQLLLLQAMDPVERVRWSSAPDLLDEGQEALLRDLGERYQDD